MTIDEAISHALEVAEQNETQAEKWREEGGEEWGKTTTCRECAADHRQLAKWLIELKDLREENKVLTSECDRLIKEKGELLSKVSGGDVLRICQLEEQLQAELDNNHCLEIELKEAKRLLKMAVDDISTMPCNNDTHSPDSCYICVKHGNCSYADSFKWCKADEALKLINMEK
jgi:hypothetical protein